MFCFARKVAFKLSYNDSHTWLKLNHCQTCHVFCWWVSIFDQFSCLCTSLAKNPKHVLFFGEGRLHELPVTGHQEALGILDDALSRYCKIIQNVEMVPVTAIAMAWDANRTKERSPKVNLQATKCSAHADDTNLVPKSEFVEEPVDKSGPLIYTEDQKLMSLPLLAPQDRICAANAHDGYACRHRNCKFIHEKDVTK
jgi:hypothetical protein